MLTHHLGDKNKHLCNTASIVDFMNEASPCRMVNGFSDRKITHNQNKAKESGHALILEIWTRFVAGQIEISRSEKELKQSCLVNV